MTTPDAGPFAELRSYGRRRGRVRSARQDGLLRHSLDAVAVDLGIPFAPKAPQTWLEIGFGGGEHLIWQAERNAGVALIGCEPFEDGVVKVLDRVADLKLSNVSVHMGDARDILRWLPEGSISRAFVLFPDPWPKRKQRKRRLINPATLAALARVMKPGADLRIGTDIGDYANTILEGIAGEPALSWTAACPADWRERPADWPPTRYEERAVRDGRRRYYLRFVRR